MSDYKYYREEVVNTAHDMAKTGLNFGTWGNISLRTAPDLVSITPSGIPYHELQPDDICVLDLYGQVVEGFRKPSTEFPLHLAIHKSRKDIQAVVHVHSKYASAFAVARQAIPVALEEMAQLIGAAVPVAAYALPGSSMLAENTVVALKEGYAVLLPAHGLVTLGNGLQEAVLRCLVIERSAQTILNSHLLGTPVLLEEEDIKALREKYIHSYGQAQKK